MAGELTVGDAIRNYITALAPTERPTVVPVLNSFGRWFGLERGLVLDAPELLRETQPDEPAHGFDVSIIPVREALRLLEDRLQPLLDTLERVRAGLAAPTEVAVIEVGENTYGHPTPSTLAALAEVKNEVLQKGLDELRSIVTAIRQFGVPDSAFAVDLGVVRGLDYYTRTAFEFYVVGREGQQQAIGGGGHGDDAGQDLDDEGEQRQHQLVTLPSAASTRFCSSRGLNGLLSIRRMPLCSVSCGSR